jgi:hypothetical protein
VQTDDFEQLGEWLAVKVARLRGRKDAPWSALEIRTRPAAGFLGLSMRRLDLAFTLGPLSNQYPTTAAREMFDELPTLVQLAVQEGVLYDRRRAFVGDPRRDEEMDDEEHLTLRVTLPISLAR